MLDKNGKEKSFSGTLIAIRVLNRKYAAVTAREANGRAFKR